MVISATQSGVAYQCPRFLQLLLPPPKSSGTMKTEVTRTRCHLLKNGNYQRRPRHPGSLKFNPKYQILSPLVVPVLSSTSRTLELADLFDIPTDRITEDDNIDVYEGEINSSWLERSRNIHLDQTSRYSFNYNDNSVNRIEVIEMACEEYSQEILGFSDVIASGNPTPYYDPNRSTTYSDSHDTRSGIVIFFLEEVDAFLAIEDDPTSPGS
ncbi:hypothetical protein Tco_0012529 [Tanacetum coccineum]